MRPTDRLYPRVTFGALPDDVLLETFELYLGKDVLDHISGHNYDGWQTHQENPPALARGNTGNAGTI